jgi:uracil-DNA glycosylase
MEQDGYLHAMGISIWRSREGSLANVDATRTSPPPPSPISSDEGGGDLDPTSEQEAPPLNWNELKTAALECQSCRDLVNNRTQVVFGVGSKEADLLIVGEAPGADEDQQGEPFVGQNGMMFNKMLHAIELSRDQVYIANIIKCSPSNNRDPHQDEMAHCADYLRRQIDLVNPKIILAVGRIAAQSLLDTHESIAKLRGQLHKTVQGRTVIVTFHPAYLLRSPKEKQKSWHDLMLVHQSLKEL